MTGSNRHPTGRDTSSRLRFITALFVICLVTLAGSVIGARDATAAAIASEADTRAQIDASLNGEERLPLPIERVREILKIHYLDGNGALHWVGSDRLQQLIDRLANAEVDGLKPKDYPSDYLIELRDSAQLQHAEHAAYTELMFSAFFLVYAADMKVGRFVPNKIDSELFLDRRTVDGPGMLALLEGYRDLNGFFDAWEPQRREYRALKALLAHYRQLEAGGGWPVISAGETLKPGMTDPRVAEVKARLKASGDFSPSSSAPEEFDDALVDAVKRFQRRHGLDADGVIGKQSLLALNIKVNDRVRQIIVNMERWRWMPENLGSDYVKVNIAGFQLTRVQSEQVVRRMNVVVGKVYHRTPVFSDKIRYLEFNPTWTVPNSIATKEMLPALKKDPNRYAAKGFDIYRGGEKVSWAGIDWSQYSTKKFPFVFQQQPGETNALGRVKFMFPNKHNVYLHDTAARSLFAKSFRALSHGCVRLGEPIAFADEVLASMPGWSRDRIDDVLASQETTRVSLKSALPVHLVYETAWLGEDGTIHFRPDIYSRDKRLHNAIFAKHTP